MLDQTPPKKKLIVVSAPSGAGKTTITKRILDTHRAHLMFSISATTRKQRPNEHDGADYYFLTKDKFDELIQTNALIEHETIFGNEYGTPASEIDRATQMGKSLLFDIDVKGGISIQQRFPADTLLIFIAPPNLNVLEARLRNRQTESEEVITRRLERAGMEMEMSSQYDIVIINDDLETAIHEVERAIFPT